MEKGMASSDHRDVNFVTGDSGVNFAKTRQNQRKEGDDLTPCPTQLAEAAAANMATDWQSAGLEFALLRGPELNGPDRAAQDAGRRMLVGSTAVGLSPVYS